MSKNLSVIYYQENKEGLQKKLVQDVKIFLKNTKKKNDIIVVNITKISQKRKSKTLLSIEISYYNYNKVL